MSHYTLENNKWSLGRLQEARASSLYNQLYNNALFVEASKGQPEDYGNALLDEALAICGHPHHKLSDTKWDDKAFEFLRKFARY